jgi:hypothetical protein
VRFSEFLQSVDYDEPRVTMFIKPVLHPKSAAFVLFGYCGHERELGQIGFGRNTGFKNARLQASFRIFERQIENVATLHVNAAEGGSTD